MFLEWKTPDILQVQSALVEDYEFVTETDLLVWS